ncbi:hypothetical protein C8J57DRAFT_1676008 [Mycena rebaudengoi]|nr:hypothetical protein C8J57DRAFT_1676008 [Mycena rebaudengoi]
MSATENDALRFEFADKDSATRSRQRCCSWVLQVSAEHWKSRALSSASKSHWSFLLRTVRRTNSAPDDCKPSGARAPPPTLFEYAQLCQLGLLLIQITPATLHLWLLSYGAKRIRARICSITSRWGGDVLDVHTQFDPQDVEDSLRLTVKLPNEPSLRERIKTVAPQLIKGTGEDEQLSWTAPRRLHGQASSPRVYVGSTLRWATRVLSSLGTTVPPTRRPETTYLKSQESRTGPNSCDKSACSHPSAPGLITLRNTIFCVAKPPKEDDEFRKIDENIRMRVVDRIPIPPGDTFEGLSVQLRHPSDTSTVQCEAGIMALVSQNEPDLITSQTTVSASIYITHQAALTGNRMIGSSVRANHVAGCARSSASCSVKMACSLCVNRTHRIVLERVPPSGLSIGVLEHLRDVLLMALSGGAGDRAPAQCTKVPTIALPRSADRMELTQYYVCHSRVCIDTIIMLIRAFSLPSLYALGYFSRLRQGDIFLSAVSERLF